MVQACGRGIGEALEAGSGLILRRDAPKLRSSLDRALRSGALQRVLPGVYAPPGALDVGTRARAALLVDPDAVITGPAAAALSWWPEIPVGAVDVASRGHRSPSSTVRWHQQVVHPDHVVTAGPLRITNVPLTVLDLMLPMGGRPIDEALRRRVVTLADLEATLAQLPHRQGNALRRALLLDSRDEPWSEAERRLHRRFRNLALPYAIRTNFRVCLPDGTHRFIDVALPELLLGFEVDGYEHHSGFSAFRGDRAADADLALLGWQRVRFDATTVFDDAERVDHIIRGVVSAREALFRGTRPAGTRVRRPR